MARRPRRRIDALVEQFEQECQEMLAREAVVFAHQRSKGHLRTLWRDVYPDDGDPKDAKVQAGIVQRMMELAVLMGESYWDYWASEYWIANDLTHRQEGALLPKRGKSLSECRLEWRGQSIRFSVPPNPPSTKSALTTLVKDASQRVTAIAIQVRRFPAKVALWGRTRTFWAAGGVILDKAEGIPFFSAPKNPKKLSESVTLVLRYVRGAPGFEVAARNRVARYRRR